jgi:hypothetical protein
MEYQYERDFLRGKNCSSAQTPKPKRTNFSTSVLIKAPNLELEPRPALNSGCKKMKIDGVIPGNVQSSLRTMTNRQQIGSRVQQSREAKGSASIQYSESATIFNSRNEQTLTRRTSA